MRIKYDEVTLLLTILFVSASWSLPAPKYLSVPHWQSCTRTVTKETAKFVCLPAKKPAECPRQSWMKLAKKQLVEKCE